jgi:RNA polymerase sigma-B factor
VLLDRAAIASAARRLDDRDRRILLLVYFCDCTQAEAAAELGLSQAHVSRLLRRAMAKMRRYLGEPPLSQPQRPVTLRGDGDGRGEADAIA